MEWEHGKRQACSNFQSKIDEMYIRNGKKDFELNSAEQFIIKEITNFLNIYAKTDRLLLELIAEDFGKLMKPSPRLPSKIPNKHAGIEKKYKEGAYSPDEEYDLYKELKKIFSNATREVFIVDAYVDETIYEL